MPIQLHSEYSPSQLDRIILCPGSVQLCQRVPKAPTTGYAEEGTYLHSCMDKLLVRLTGEDPGPFAEEPTEEQAELLGKCFGYLESHIDLRGTDIVAWGTELKVSLTPWALDEVYGTLDLGVVTPDAIHVFDWKFGGGVLVSPIENTQLIAYALGFVAQMIHGFTQENRPIYLHIVQPRLDNMGWWELPRERIEPYLHSVREAIELSKSIDPPFHPGVTQCRWCDAAGVCRVKMDQTQAQAQKVFEMYDAISDNIVSKEEVGAFLDQSAELESHIKAIKAYARLELAKGGEIPGYKLVMGKKNRVWIDESKVIKYFNDHDLDLSELFDQKVKTPAQVEKLIPAKAKKAEAFTCLFYNPQGEVRMVPESDKGESVNGILSVDEVFKDC